MRLALSEKSPGDEVDTKQNGTEQKTKFFCCYFCERFFLFSFFLLHEQKTKQKSFPTENFPNNPGLTIERILTTFKKEKDNSC